MKEKQERYLIVGLINQCNQNMKFVMLKKMQQYFCLCILEEKVENYVVV